MRIVTPAWGGLDRRVAMVRPGAGRVGEVRPVKRVCGELARLGPSKRRGRAGLDAISDRQTGTAWGVGSGQGSARRLGWRDAGKRGSACHSDTEWAVEVVELARRGEIRMGLSPWKEKRKWDCKA